MHIELNKAHDQLYFILLIVDKDKVLKFVLYWYINPHIHYVDYVNRTFHKYPKEFLSFKY